MHTINLDAKFFILEDKKMLFNCELIFIKQISKK